MRPTWLVDALAAVMLITAAYCVGRLAVVRLWRRATHVDVDVAHVAMGVAMAGMLLPSLRSLSSGVWEIVFAGIAVWFAGQIVHFVRRWGVRGWDEDHLHHVSHYVTHLAMVVAMLYMFAAFPSSAALAGSMSVMGSSHTGAADSGIPLVLAFVLLVAAVWYGDSLTRFRRRAGVRAAPGGDDRTHDLGVVPQPAANVAAVSPVAAAVAEPRGEATVAVRNRAASIAAPVLRAHDGRWLAPRLEIATHITMCFTMGYMLIVMR